MSRIFDALQKSGIEQSGVEYPDMVSVATAVFEASTGEGSSHVAVEPGAVLPTSERVQVTDTPQKTAGAYPAFPSLEVSVAASSRLVFFNEPESLAAEKFRFLGVRLRQLRQARVLKKVLVTSTIPEEGKSVISINLAGALARRKQRVLLIEGDMRRPVLAEQFGMGRLAGLAEWLQDGLEEPSNIYYLQGPGLWIMPSGGPPANPMELLQSPRLSTLMAQLTTLFDWIVVDSPPLLPLADTTVWAKLTDGTLLVAREGKTEKGPLQRGLEIIKKSNLLGIVLNGCSNADHDSYYRRYANQDKR
jgi:capsular exopolysaccharide synthesis family protein